MNNIVLKAQKRDEAEKVKILRRESMVPGIVYGNKKENISIKIDNSELIKAYRKAGESSIISLDIDGETTEVLIHNFQKAPVNGDFLHIDFYAITRGQAVTTNIRLNFIGNSEAVKEGAILEEYIKEIEVSVLPRNLVESIDVDISCLKEFGDSIRIKDLNLDPEKFELSNDDEDLIAIASEPKKVVVEEEAPESAEVPVVGEEKQEEDSEENK